MATSHRSFEAYMEAALYGPDGFYTVGGRAGRRGDFITSPEVGPLFGTVVARFLDTEWELLGRPTPFTVVDAGAGPGTLARTVFAARPACANALRYIAVEAATVQREQHPVGVESLSDLPAEPFDGVVFANELLDNIPFRLAVYDGAWREAHVVQLADGTLAEQLSAPFDPVPTCLPSTAAHGARAPLHDAARVWVERARSLVRRGRVIAIDYCTPTTVDLARRPWRDWLRTYHGHERGGHYLSNPGLQDITTEVAIDQLPHPVAGYSQAEWLQLHGIADLVNEGKRHWAVNAARPDVAAMKMRSRVGEAEALLDPDGLGGFTVLEWSGRARC